MAAAALTYGGPIADSGRLKLKQKRNPESRPKFRLVKTQHRRFAVHRQDACGGEWFPIYFDDLAQGALVVMKHRAALADGIIVCSGCNAKLARPRIDRESVTCAACRPNAYINGVNRRILMALGALAAVLVLVIIFG